MNKLKTIHPLVVNITNNVTINDIANVLTMINASPIMTAEIDEIEDLLKLAKELQGSLVINIGTITKLQANLMKRAVKIANQLALPVILDPVGAGASKFRTELCLELLQKNAITIVRGNFSEITALVESNVQSKGVDTVKTTDPKVAQRLACKYKTVVLLSGKVDYLASETEFFKIEGGSDLLPKISGTGCILTSIIGAYAAIYPPIQACKHGLTLMLNASEKAEQKSRVIPEFKQNLFNELARSGNED